MRKIMIIGVLIALAGYGPAHALDQGDLDIHGFASTGYIKSTDNNFLVPSEDGSLEFNEAGLNVSASLTDNIRAGMQLFSRDLGNVGNNRMKLDWAFLDWIINGVSRSVYGWER